MNFSQLYFHLDPQFIRSEPNPSQRRKLRARLVYRLLLKSQFMTSSQIDALATQIDPYPNGGSHPYFESRKDEFAGLMRSYRSQGMVLGIQYLSMFTILYKFVLNRTYILSFSLVLHLQQWSPLKRALVANALIVPYSLYRWRKYVTNDVNLYEAAVNYDLLLKK